MFDNKHQISCILLVSLSSPCVHDVRSQEPKALTICDMQPSLPFEQLWTCCLPYNLISLTSDRLDPVVFNRFRINIETMNVSDICYMES